MIAGVSLHCGGKWQNVNKSGQYYGQCHELWRPLESNEICKDLGHLNWIFLSGRYETLSAYKRGRRQGGSEGNLACLSKCQWLLQSGVSVRGMHPTIRRESEIKDFRVWCTLASQSSLLLSALSLAELLYGSWKSQLHRPWGFSVRWDEAIQWMLVLMNCLAWASLAMVRVKDSCLFVWKSRLIAIMEGSMPCPWGILWGEGAKEISDNKDTSVPKPASTNPWQLRLCYTGCFPWSWA